MKAFSGFPAGKVSYTSIPNLFFSELLPLIDSLAELKVTLHVLWRLGSKKAPQRYVPFGELLGDGALLHGLEGLASSPEEALRDGLRKAVARGTLLYLVTSGEPPQHLYVANSEQGRRMALKVQAGEAHMVERGALDVPAVTKERPNIFVLYEQNIGLLQPIIAEELQDAENMYSPEWIEDAFRIAVENNVRNWKYVRRILERWATEGKDDDRGGSPRRTWYSEEEYEKFIKH
jgi:DnaD/phage-associated family protein